MPEITEPLVIPEGLIVGDQAILQNKLAGFVTSGAAVMHAVFDFDRTLTVKKPGTQDEVTAWHILREHLAEDGQLQYRKLFEKYRALEISGELTQQDAVDWWSASLNLFVDHKIDLTAVEETFLDRASIRPGVTELFQFLADNNIPAIILSAGIRDVIDIWCRKYGVRPSLVISTSLEVDSDNHISGWQKESLVHVLNKSEATHPELLTIRQNRPKVLVVGDSLDDASMAVGDHDVIRVRIVDPRDDELPTGQEERKTFEMFDALIRTGSLHPLKQFFELIV
jgi:HAD superfamily hydrolase (TIGR01544 family)